MSELRNRLITFELVKAIFREGGNRFRREFITILEDMTGFPETTEAEKILITELMDYLPKHIAID